jgi:hypothetical protein
MLNAAAVLLLSAAGRGGSTACRNLVVEGWLL